MSRKICKECEKEIVLAKELEVYGEGFYHIECMKECRGCGELIPKDLDVCSFCSEGMRECYSCEKKFFLNEVYLWHGKLYCKECAKTIVKGLEWEIRGISDFFSLDKEESL